MQNLSYKLTINGKVQGVGYRMWFQKICNARGVVGFVKNSKTSKSVVEACICGQASAVNRIIQLSHEGPRNAAVESVIKEPVSETEAQEFDQLEIH